MAVGDSVPTHFVIEFSTRVHQLAQQGMSRLREYCDIVPMKGEAWAYDGIGQVEAVELTGRFNQSIAQDILHTRRKVPRRQFVTTLFSDKWDTEARLVDPKGLYAQACAAAMERRFDLTVYQAMFADVQTGKDFSTTLTFAQDGGLTVTATGGITLDDLLEGKQNFTDSEMGNKGSIGTIAGSNTKFKKLMGITGDEERVLLQIQQISSRDFSNQMPLQDGELEFAAGIEFIKYGANPVGGNPLLTVTGGVRTSFIMAAGSMIVGMTRDAQITIKDRPDLVNTDQIQITMSIGACRKEGRGVQKITTTD